MPGVFDDSPVFAALGFSLESMQARARQLSSATNADQVFPFTAYRDFMDSVVSFNELVFKLQRESLNQISKVDDLTGLGNDQAMRDQIEVERERARRSSLPTCVALAELTGFSSADEDAGQVGEAESLVLLAQALHDNLRLYDQVYRYEGDIFLVCLPNTDLKTAELVVGRLHGLITENPGALEDDTKVKFELSFGIAPVGPEESVESIMAHVSSALREAVKDDDEPVKSWAAVNED